MARTFTVVTCVISRAERRGGGVAEVTHNPSGGSCVCLCVCEFENGGNGLLCAAARGLLFLTSPVRFFFSSFLLNVCPPPVWLATGFLRLLQNDNRLLIYSELISPLIRGLVNLRAGNSRGVDLKDRMTERKRKRRSARSQGVSRKGC